MKRFEELAVDLQQRLEGPVLEAAEEWVRVVGEHAQVFQSALHGDIVIKGDKGEFRFAKGEGFGIFRKYAAVLLWGDDLYRYY